MRIPTELIEIIRRLGIAISAIFISHGRISIKVPSATNRHISSISSFVTAMQPSVQSFSLCDAPTHP